MDTQSQYRATLEALRETIISELQTIATKNPDSGDWEAHTDASEQAEADENSEADASEELETRTAIVTDLETSYRNIERALEKISLGTYGLCEICSTPIAPSRLDILPSARTCSLHLDDEPTLAL